MIQPTFPRTQGSLSRETYLTLLLLALVNQAGGELHLSAPALEAIDAGAKLVIDWDTSAQQLVIRAATSSLVVVEVRGTGWTNATTQPPAIAPPPPSPPDPSKHRVMTEDQLLQAVARKVREDQLRQWRESGAAAVAGMPPPDDDRTPQ